MEHNVEGISGHGHEASRETEIINTWTAVQR